MSHRSKIILSSVAALAIVGLVVWGVSSGGDTVDPGAANPESAAIDYERALADAPPQLAKLYANGDALIGGGAEALDSQLAALKGFPVVVNVWASWCGPCRSEFPELQKASAKRGDQVAFIGVDANDNDAAARDFLAELPVPYPSISDPDEQLKKRYNLRGYPSTAFYNSAGDVVYVKQGPYTSESELIADIDKYAS
jgi:cytochrome c biogenesis protein CcmG/thiol:disulfide interchange protein DsbE